MVNRKTVVAQKSATLRTFANARNAIIYLLGLYSAIAAALESNVSRTKRGVSRESWALFNVSLSSSVKEHYFHITISTIYAWKTEIPS